MSSLLTKDEFPERLYNTLPPVYRAEDEFVDHALQRYLYALSDGGFAHVLTEINGLLDLQDPDKTPAEILPIIFEHYGLKIFNGLPEKYLRNLLPILGDLYARKGATTVLEYLTSIISDVKSEVVISPNFMEDYHIDLRLEMDYARGDNGIPDREQLLRVAKEFLPFFIDMTIIFMFMFYEIGNLRATEEELMYVHDVRNEYATFKNGVIEGYYPALNNPDILLNNNFYLNETYYWTYDVDYCYDKIMTSIHEEGNLYREFTTQYQLMLNNPDMRLNNTFVLNQGTEVDWYIDKIVTAVISEVQRITMPEVHFHDYVSFETQSRWCYMLNTEKVLNKDFILNEAMRASDEVVNLYHRGRPVSDDSTFGNAIFGEAIFDQYSDYSDEFRDNITTAIQVFSGNLHEPIDTILNREYNVLNDSFYLNGLYNYDVIRTGFVLNAPTVFLNGRYNLNGSERVIIPFETGNVAV